MSLSTARLVALWKLSDDAEVTPERLTDGAYALNNPIGSSDRRLLRRVDPGWAFRANTQSIAVARPHPLLAISPGEPRVDARLRRGRRRLRAE